MLREAVSSSKLIKDGLLGKSWGNLAFFILALTIFKQAFRIFSAFWILYQTMVWMTVSASAIINPFTQITPFTLLWAAPHRPASFVAARPRDWREARDNTETSMVHWTEDLRQGSWSDTPPGVADPRQDMAAVFVAQERRRLPFIRGIDIWWTQSHQGLLKSYSGEGWMVMWGKPGISQAGNMENKRKRHLQWSDHTPIVSVGFPLHSHLDFWLNQCRKR